MPAKPRGLDSIRTFHVSVYNQKQGGCWIVLSGMSDKLPTKVFRHLAKHKRRRIAIGRLTDYEMIVCLNPPKSTLIELSQNCAFKFATWLAHATMSEMFPRTTARIYIPKALSSFFKAMPTRKVATLYEGLDAYFLSVSE